MVAVGEVVIALYDDLVGRLHRSTVGGKPLIAINSAGLRSVVLLVDCQDLLRGCAERAGSRTLAAEPAGEEGHDQRGRLG